MIESRAFRDALGRFTTGVTVVTTEDDGDPRGITVNAFMSLSLDPPLIGVSIDAAAGAHDTLMEGERFGVSMLGAGQAGTSDWFAGRPGTPAPSFVRLGEVPVVAGAIAHLDCRVVDRLATGDHTLFVGEVQALAVAEGAPLIYFRGRYGGA